MTELSADGLEPLRADAEFTVFRDRRDAGRGRILVVAAVSDEPAQRSLRQLKHEYALRSKLDPAWAVRALELLHENGRTILVLEDPGGQPLDQLLEPASDVPQFLRNGIGLASGVGKLHQRGIIHRDI